MTIAELIPLAISTSIILTVFALGLDAKPKDATWLFRHPGLLFRSILSMNVIMVLFAIAVAAFFNLDPAIKIAIVCLALSPVPPSLPKKEHKVGGVGSYAIGLLVAAALCSIVLVPGWLELLGSYFGFEAHLGLRKIVPIIVTKILAPLLAGMLVGQVARQLADRLVKPITIVATVLLLAAVLPVLFVSWHAMWAMVGNGVLITLALFSIVGILVGHLLGGPDPDNRSVLALATSIRHPGIALAIASLNFPEEKKAVLIVFLFHLILGSIVAIPYIKWRKSQHTRLAEKESL